MSKAYLIYFNGAFKTLDDTESKAVYINSDDFFLEAIERVKILPFGGGDITIFQTYEDKTNTAVEQAKDKYHSLGISKSGIYGLLEIDEEQKKIINLTIGRNTFTLGIEAGLLLDKNDKVFFDKGLKQSIIGFIDANAQRVDYYENKPYQESNSIQNITNDQTEQLITYSRNPNIVWQSSPLSTDDFQNEWLQKAVEMVNTNWENYGREPNSIKRVRNLLTHVKDGKLSEEKGLKSIKQTLKNTQDKELKTGLYKAFRAENSQDFNDELSDITQNKNLGTESFYEL